MYMCMNVCEKLVRFFHFLADGKKQKKDIPHLGGASTWNTDNTCGWTRAKSVYYITINHKNEKCIVLRIEKSHMLLIEYTQMQLIDRSKYRIL